MSYAIHTTTGLIISSRAYGEAGKMISIFTRDLGLVTAIAQGIRLEKSKLRYHSQEHSFGTFSLVRGKEFWRLTSAQGLNGAVRSDIFVRMAALLKRLLHGEEPHPELFDCLYAVAETNKAVSSEQIPLLESLTALRILNLLGYIGDSEEIRPFVSSHTISEEILENMRDLRLKVNGLINASLQASHL